AFHEAELRHTGVVAVHSWRPRPAGLFLDGSTEEEEFRRQFGEKHRAFIEYVRPWARQYPQVPLWHRLYTLPPTESLLLESTRGQLLTLGPHRRSLGSPGLGQVTRRCLTEASCPVLVSGGGQRVEQPESAASRTWSASRQSSAPAGRQ
ncbi:MAG: UspA domain protein, partial [Propionibacteriaceae bacterium]|nr:UspA domain protein [Propionibacteriaceae bacterium]